MVLKRDSDWIFRKWFRELSSDEKVDVQKVVVEKWCFMQWYEDGGKNMTVKSGSAWVLKKSVIMR